MERKGDFNPLQAAPEKRVLAIMPFYAAGAGVGHSDVDLRRAYLNATIYPLQTMFPNIVVSVSDKSDLQFVKDTNFPFFDILYNPGIPDPRKLGVATLFGANRALNNDMTAAGSQLRGASGWGSEFRWVYCEFRSTRLPR